MINKKHFRCAAKANKNLISFISWLKPTAMEAVSQNAKDLHSLCPFHF